MSDQIYSISAAGRHFEIAVPPNAGPRLLFWGPASAYEGHQEPSWPALPSSADERHEKELFPLPGKGFFGEAALIADGPSSGIFGFRLQSIDHESNRVALHYSDPSAQTGLVLFYEILKSGLLRSRARIQNDSDSARSLLRLNALTLPLPHWINMADLTYGGWSKEGHHKRVGLVAGKIEQTGTSGRPGFDGGPHMLLTKKHTDESTGGAIAIALAHSGNFALAAECMGSGEKHVFAAESLQLGEIKLEPGESYQSPWALAAISTNGLTEISAQFHAHARDAAPSHRQHRPVQLNSWEALYFNINEQSAMGLAKAASDLGAERFVLDDGWFKNRHNDQQALGDWEADTEKFPNGLGPLAEFTKELGMEFGLWVEPEMVSEESDLFRHHPDWILSSDGKAGPTGRHQLVLNLSRDDVQDFIFNTITKLLSTIDISYLKWDCNRDLFPTGTKDGPSTHKQIAGLYALLNRIRNAHPNVAIESCASGGGRIDLGVTQYADRFWTSDSTDPFERIRIQKRTSLYYPVEMLGAHVGASPDHWTDRHSTMAFRCLTAFFGHFGVELDPRSLSDFDRHILGRAIELYKAYRQVIIDGSLVRVNNHDDALDVQLIIAADQQSALLRVLRTAEPHRHSLPPIRINGLPAQTCWRVFELAIGGSHQNTLIGECGAEWLAYSGIDVNPAHAGQGRLYLLEKI